MAELAMEMVYCFSFNLLRNGEVGMGGGRGRSFRDGTGNDVEEAVGFSYGDLD